MKKKQLRSIKGNISNEISTEELRSEITQCLQIENLNFLIGADVRAFVPKAVKNKHFELWQG